MPPASQSLMTLCFMQKALQGFEFEDATLSKQGSGFACAECWEKLLAPRVPLAASQEASLQPLGSACNPRKSRVILENRSEASQAYHVVKYR